MDKIVLTVVLLGIPYCEAREDKSVYTETVDSMEECQDLLETYVELPFVHSVSCKGISSNE